MRTRAQTSGLTSAGARPSVEQIGGATRTYAVREVEARPLLVPAARHTKHSLEAAPARMTAGGGFGCPEARPRTRGRAAAFARGGARRASVHEVAAGIARALRRGDVFEASRARALSDEPFVHVRRGGDDGAMPRWSAAGSMAPLGFASRCSDSGAHGREDVARCPH